MERMVKGRQYLISTACRGLRSGNLASLCFKCQADDVAIEKTAGRFAPDQQAFAKKGGNDSAGCFDRDAKHQPEVFPAEVVDPVAFTVTQPEQQSGHAHAGRSAGAGHVNKPLLGFLERVLQSLHQVPLEAGVLKADFLNGTHWCAAGVHFANTKRGMCVIARQESFKTGYVAWFENADDTCFATA